MAAAMFGTQVLQMNQEDRVNQARGDSIPGDKIGSTDRMGL